MKILTGNEYFVPHLLSEVPDDLKAGDLAREAFKDFELGNAAEGCSFAIADPGGTDETYIVVASGASAKESGHSDATLATVAWSIQRNLELWDWDWFKGASDVNSRLVRWFEISEIGHISEKKDEEPWEPFRFHSDGENDARPFTKFEIESSPYFGTWNQIYIRIYHGGPLDSSYGTTNPQYVDLLEYRSSFERVNFSRIAPSEYLERLSSQFDESPLAKTYQRWWELPSVLERPDPS